MTIDEIRSLYEYNGWANARLAEVVAGLDEERLVAPVVSSFPSLLATFAHIVSAEWIWLARWHGTSPTELPDWLEDPAFPTLLNKLAEVESERLSFIDGLREEQLDAMVSYRRFNGESQTTRLADLFLHVVNHSSYHRGQLTTILRQVGATPVSTDIINFKREQPSR